MKAMEVWGKEGHEKEKKGSCLSRLTLISAEAYQDGWRYRFRRAETDREFAEVLEKSRHQNVESHHGQNGTHTQGQRTRKPIDESNQGLTGAKGRKFRRPIDEAAQGLSGAKVLIRREGGGMLLGSGKLEKVLPGGVVSIFATRALRRASVRAGGLWRIDKDEFAGQSEAICVPVRDFACHALRRVCVRLSGQW